MFYAIDSITGEIILSINVRSDNYKNTYNKSLKYICSGCNDNGDKCGDKNVSFVNSKVKQSHFRHSKNTECSASKEFKEYNKEFYNKWYDLFKKEYRKPYWYNVNLEQIRDDNNVIMIKYSQQTEKTIKNIEKYINYKKLIWILSSENRKYDRFFHHKGKIYIDFIGTKNDIPLFDNEKSIIYLDTGFDVLFKIKLESYNYNGQEIEIIYIKDFCKEFDYLFTSYPYRKKLPLLDKVLYEYNEYNITIEKLLKEYKEYNNILIMNKQINILYKLFDIFDKLKKLNYNIIFNYQEEYDILNIKIDIELAEINKITKNIEFYKYINLYNENKLYNYLQHKNCDNILQEIKKLKYIYNKLFKYNKIIDNKYDTYDYYIGKDSSEDLKDDYNYLLKTEYIIIDYCYINEYLKEYYNNHTILKKYEDICYEYLNTLYNKKKEEKLLLIKQQKEEELRLIQYQKEEELRLIQYQNEEEKKLKFIKQKDKEKKLKLKKQLEKQQNDKENIIVTNKYNNYIEKYKVSDKDLILILLDIIISNNKNINDINDIYLHKYYIFITHPLNYDVSKMIKYIIYQENYLK